MAAKGKTDTASKRTSSKSDSEGKGARKAAAKPAAQKAQVKKVSAKGAATVKQTQVKKAPPKTTQPKKLPSSKAATKKLKTEALHFSGNKLLFYGFKPDLEVELYRPSDIDIMQYAETITERNDPNFSLNQFLEERYNVANDRNLIADLSNMEISPNEQEEVLDLSGANFRGSFFHGTQFVNCNLTNSLFNDAVLTKVTFRHTNLDHCDFRGCNLESTMFGEEYEIQPLSQLNGVKFSYSSSEIRTFADIKNETAKKNEYQRMLDTKRLELREASIRTSAFKKISYKLGFKVAPCAYTRISDEISKMERGVFKKEYIIHKSINYLFLHDSCSHYPVYEKYLKDVTKIKHKKYVKLTREDLEEFVAITGKEKQIPLNEFAKQKYLSAQGEKYELAEDVFIVADLSSKVNKFGNNEWNRMNLTGLSFIGKDMSLVNFAGTDLSKCKFQNTNLAGSNLNCCKLSDSSFTGANLTDCSFIRSDFTNAQLENCDIYRSDLTWTNMHSVRIIDSDIRYCHGQNSIWQNAYLEGCDFTGSDLTMAKFIKAKIYKSHFFECILFNANYSKAKLDNSNVEGTVLDCAKLTDTLWNEVVFKSITARRADFTGAKFSENTVIVDADMEEAVLDGFKASKCVLTRVNFDSSKIGYAKFGGTKFEDCSFRFVDFNSVVMADCSAINVDFTASSFYNTRLMKSNLQSSDFWGVKINSSDLSEANFTNANWFSVEINGSVLDKINNHRVKINDCTQFQDCILKNLDGQFYHYDEEDFMEVMFIEQQQMHQQKIEKIIRLKKYGALAPFFKFISKDYKITKKERSTLLKSRKRNRQEFKNHCRYVREREPKALNLNKFRVVNTIKSHNLK